MPTSDAVASGVVGKPHPAAPHTLVSPHPFYAHDHAVAFRAELTRVGGPLFPRKRTSTNCVATNWARAFLPALVASDMLSKKTVERSTGTALQAQ